MNQRVIESPKVFISYSWTTPEHEVWVVELGTRLRENGVDVTLDKWDLKEGHDTTFFMESMKAADKVLIICDKGYKEKANGRKGGVGTEAQIITPDVYGDVSQEKYIPIVAERDEMGQHYIPTFIESRLYIDLSSFDSFEESYEKLLRNIYQAPLHNKPALGKAPEYLFQSEASHSKTASILRQMKSNVDRYPQRLKYQWGNFVDAYIESLKYFTIEKVDNPNEIDEVIVEKLLSMLPMRNDYIEGLELMVLSDSLEVDDIIDFFERIYIFTEFQNEGSFYEVQFDHYKFLITELFMYTTLILLKTKKYNLLSQLTNAEFIINSNNNHRVLKSFTRLRFYPSSLENRNKRLELRRTSLYADILIQRAGTRYKQELIESDIVLYNISKFLVEEAWGRVWFPSTYIYASEYGTIKLFHKLKSRKHFEEIKVLFNNPKEDVFKSKINEMSVEQGYPSSWNEVPLIRKYINPEEVCSKP
ncbi:SEFIR domain-containing protein [Paenibacillus sp. FSL R5-0914]|uniref:SEFIR domain-containing protein n=1 Tax=Paenibacillus sp. FSL R5-0914 TaxID=2921665 RepID=UPI0030FBE247